MHISQIFTTKIKSKEGQIRLTINYGSRALVSRGRGQPPYNPPSSVNPPKSRVQSRMDRLSKNLRGPLSKK